MERLHKRAGLCALMALLFACLLAAVALVPAQAQAATSGVKSYNEWSNDYTYGRWAKTVKSYVCEAPSSNLQRVEYTGGKLVVEEYDANYQLVSSQTIPQKNYLPEGLTSTDDMLWGGFFAGEKYNFVVTGQANPNESASLQVVRVCQFSKDWECLGAVGLYKINTTVPFDAGSLRMLELNGQLWIRTSHEMYQSSDGLNHQSNMTFVIDEESLFLEDGFYGVMNIGNKFGYVSHSFNQYVAKLDNTVYAVDHGDAYPRSVVVKKLGYTGSYANILALSGSYGDNDTYATVGGLEASATNKTLLTVGSSVDQSKVTSTKNPYNLPYNVWLTVTNASTLSTKTFALTSYSKSDNKTVTNPVLVKVNDDKFMVAWGVEDNDGWGGPGNTYYYQFVDGAGTALSDVKSAPGMLSDCQPIVRGDSIVWYATGDEDYNSTAPVFCAVNATTFEAELPIDISTATVGKIAKQKYTGKKIKPAVTVTLGGKVLVKGSDYSVSYKNNKKVGTAKVTIKGRGIYTGKLTTTFKIAKAKKKK